MKPKRKDGAGRKTRGKHAAPRPAKQVARTVAKHGAAKVATRAAKAARKKPVKRPAKKLVKGKATKKAPLRPLPSAPDFQIRELDPQRKCGPGTSVQMLFRVDERMNGVVRPHLVFFDRHGWYCEHGRDCVAVAPARKLGVGAR